MGLNDAQEMLDVAKEQALIDERHIATLTEQVARMAHRLAAVRRVIAASTLQLQDSEDAGYEVVEVWRIEQVLDAPDEQDPQP